MITFINEEEYNQLPEEVRAQIEVVDGRVVFCRSASPAHNVVARRLATAFDDARPTEPCLTVLTDFEMHYRQGLPDTPGFSFRRPDVVVNRCLDEGAKLYADDVLIAVEVVSPGSEYTDTVDKRGEYAAEGIPLYLVVHLDSALRVKLIQEYRLEERSGSYGAARTHRDALVLDEPFSVKVSFAHLNS